jgi:hypothetical protein
MTQEKGVSYQEMERELQEEVMMRRDKEVRDVKEERRLFQVRNIVMGQNVREPGPVQYLRVTKCSNQAMKRRIYRGEIPIHLQLHP